MTRERGWIKDRIKEIGREENRVKGQWTGMGEEHVLRESQ